MGWLDRKSSDCRCIDGVYVCSVCQDDLMKEADPLEALYAERARYVPGYGDVNPRRKW